MNYEIKLEVQKVKDLHKRKKAAKTAEEITAVVDEFYEYANTLHFRQKEVAEYIFIYGEYVPYYQRNKPSTSSPSPLWK